MINKAIPQNYFIDHLTLADIRTNGKIVIPSYQRQVVWSHSHRKEFIDTVKMGDPFGIILVYQDPIDKYYHLVDGLQRLSALRAYMDNPLSFIDKNDKFINEEKLLSIFKRKYEILGKSLPAPSKLEKEKSSFLDKFLKELKKSTQIQKASVVWVNVCELLGLGTEAFSVYTLFEDFYEDFLNTLALSESIKIYAIVYTGDRTQLPSVFETLNTSSVSLTKYEVFSSQWPVTKIKVEDEELIKKVYSKYKTLEDTSSFLVQATEEDIREKGMTLFEYCFGISELLYDESKDYSFIFSKTKKSTEPTGFELLSLACGLCVNNADELYKDEYLGNSSGSFLKDLEEAIVDCVKIVADSLRNWVTDLKGSVIKITSVYQIYYCIMSVFKHKYTINLKSKTITKKDNKKWISNFYKNAPKWYFYHQLTGFWNLNRQVSDLRNIIDGKIQNDVDYSKNISEEYWKQAIKDYFESKRESLTERTIPNEIKLFLNYYYRFLIDEDANRRKFFEVKFEDGDTDPEHEIKFDIEHIVPYNKFETFNKQIPMSVLGNLCYLPVKDNRSKRDKTIYQFTDERPSITYDPIFKKTIDYPDEDDLKIY